MPNEWNQLLNEFVRECYCIWMTFHCHAFTYIDSNGLHIDGVVADKENANHIGDATRKKKTTVQS